MRIRMRLLDNAYDFLNESLRDSIAAEQDSKAWKFGILNIVQSIELLLKERWHGVLIRSMDVPIVGSDPKTSSLRSKWISSPGWVGRRLLGN